MLITKNDANYLLRINGLVNYHFFLELYDILVFEH